MALFVVNCVLVKYKWNVNVNIKDATFVQSCFKKDVSLSQQYSMLNCVNLSSTPMHINLLIVINVISCASTTSSFYWTIVSYVLYV